MYYHWLVNIFEPAYWMIIICFSHDKHNTICIIHRLSRNSVREDTTLWLPRVWERKVRTHAVPVTYFRFAYIEFLVVIGSLHVCESTLYSEPASSEKMI